jgi:hypothetical protein
VGSALSRITTSLQARYRDVARQYFISGIHSDSRILHDAGLWCQSYDSVSTLFDEVDLSNSEHLPSWVPEYRSSRLSNDGSPWDVQQFHTYHEFLPPTIHEFEGNENIVGFEVIAVERVETLIVHLDEETVAKLEAAIITKRGLSSLSDNSAPGEIRSLIQLTLTILEQLQLAPNHRYPPTGENIRVALFRTLLANCTSKEIWNRIWKMFDLKYSEAVLARWEQYERCFVQEDGDLRVLLEQENSDFSKDSDDAKDVMELIWAIMHVLERRKFAITTSGLLTLIPKMADQYDLIVRIGRTRVPFVVKNGRVHEPYLIIGPCYVHGIMYNEIPYEGQKRSVMFFA